MPYPSGTYITQILDSWTRAELEQFYSLLQGYLSAQHKEDGSHSAVTADSISVTGAAVIGGDATFANDNIELKRATSGGVGTGASGAGIKLRATVGSGLGEDWAILVERDNYDDSIGFFDTTNAVEVMKLYRTAAGVYTLSPSEDGIATLNLGDHTLSKFDWDEGAFKNLYARTAIYERARTTALGEWQAFTPTWTSTGVAPAIGNGTLAGRYTQIGKTTFFELRMDAGATTTFGTGSWLFSLPTTRRNDSFVTIVSGEWYALDSSASGQYMGSSLCNTTQVQPAIGGAGAGITGGITNAAPFAWATTDALIVRGHYEDA